MERDWMRKAHFDHLKFHSNKALFERKKKKVKEDKKRMKEL